MIGRRDDLLVIESQLAVERYSEGHSANGEVPHFVLHREIVKSCAKCASVKALGDFPVGRGWDALSTRCTGCTPTV